MDDFDGDGLDEIGLQFHPDAFWPDFADDPAHSFLVHKHDAAAVTWQSLGGRNGGGHAQGEQADRDGVKHAMESVRRL